MTKDYTTDSICLLPFNFRDLQFIDLCNDVIDYGMGLTVEYLFECAFNIMFELQTIDDVIYYLDTMVFPEHVPNDSLSSCLSLCVAVIRYVLDNFNIYKQHLNLVMSEICEVELSERSSTISINFNISRASQHGIYTTNAERDKKFKSLVHDV